MNNFVLDFIRNVIYRVIFRCLISVKPRSCAVAHPMSQMSRNLAAGCSAIPMKHITLAFALCIASSITCAAEYSATGSVQKIFALDREQYGPDFNSILIAGFSAAGTCPINDGLVALALRDDETGRRQLAVALAAKLSDKPVVVRTDDSIRNSSGICFLRYFELR
jgi:hypothetical protein